MSLDQVLRAPGGVRAEPADGVHRAEADGLTDADCSPIRLSW
jgi:hypothetical protein